MCCFPCWPATRADARRGLDLPLLDKAAKGLIHINLATISVGFAQALARRMRGAVSAMSRAGVRAPRRGGKGQAACGRRRAKPSPLKKAPLLDAIGRRTVMSGEAPEQANLFKIAGNFMIASAMESMGEAFAAQEAALMPQALTGSGSAPCFRRIFGPDLSQIDS